MENKSHHSGVGSRKERLEAYGSRHCVVVSWHGVQTEMLTKSPSCLDLYPDVLKLLCMDRSGLYSALLLCC
jgi:hypothetical protein